VTAQLINFPDTPDNRDRRVAREVMALCLHDMDLYELIAIGPLMAVDAEKLADRIDEMMRKDNEE